MKKIISSLFVLACGTLPSHAALTVVQSNTEVGPSTTITVASVTTFFAGIVDLDNKSFTVDDSANHSLPGSVNAADTSFGEDRTFFRESEAANVPDPAGTRTGVVGASTMFIASTGASFHRLVRFGTATTGYLGGAQFGPDNWIYFSNNDNAGTEQPSFWVQLDLTETTATPIQYVHDPANPYGDITLSNALVAVNNVPEPSSVMMLGLSGLLFLRRKR